MVGCSQSLTVPGAKLGLANIVALYAVMTMGPGESMAIASDPVGKLLSGTFLNMAYYLSTSGALASTAVMYAFRKLFGDSLSVIGISVAGRSLITLPVSCGQFDPASDRRHVLLAVSPAVAIPTGILWVCLQENHCLHRKLV